MKNSFYIDKNTNQLTIKNNESGFDFYDIENITYIKSLSKNPTNISIAYG